MSVGLGEIDAAADEAGVPRPIFRRLVGAESGGDSGAVSPRGALGPAQLMPQTARELGVDPSDPQANLRGGARYLRQQYDAFGDWRLAANAYNWGPGNVRAWQARGSDPGELPAETRGHEARVFGARQTLALDPLGREARPRAVTANDLAISMRGFETPFPEQLGAHLRQGWDTSLPGRMFAGAGSGFDAGERPGVGALMRRNMGLPAEPGDERGFLAEDAWKASPWYRPGMGWDAAMSEPRARSMADAWDQRAYDRWLIERSPDSFWRGAAGFAAGVAGGLADPVNFVPVFGQATRAAMIARAGGGIFGRVVTGAAEAGAATALVEPFIVIEGNRLGDDMTLADAAIDIGMSAATGGLIGGAHGAWEHWRGKRAGGAQAADGGLLPAAETPAAMHLSGTDAPPHPPAAEAPGPRPVPSIKAQAASAALLDEASQAMVRGDSPQISPATLAAAGETIAGESGLHPEAIELPPRAGHDDRPIDPTDVPGSVTSFVRDALTNAGNRMHLWLGRVSERNAAAAATVGIDVRDYTRVIDQSDLRHAFKDHGSEANERPRGQRAVTAADIARIPEIVDAPDTIERGETASSRQALIYRKRLGDDLFYVEEVRVGRKVLGFKSMWIRTEKGGSGVPDAGSPKGSPFGQRPERSPVTAQDDIALVSPASQAPDGAGAAAGGLTELAPAYAEPDRTAGPGPERAPPPPPVDRAPESVGRLAETMGLTLDGAHDLDPELAQARARGLAPEHAAELDAADALVKRAGRYAEAYAAAAACFGGRG